MNLYGGAIAFFPRGKSDKNPDTEFWSGLI